VIHPPAERTNCISSALTLEIVARTAALKAEGEAGKYAIDHGITRYTEGGGTLALRKAISAKITRRMGSSNDCAMRTAPTFCAQRRYGATTKGRHSR
jgi:aspartate/methionine/tyrosine aminotransferase